MFLGTLFYHLSIKKVWIIIVNGDFPFICLQAYDFFFLKIALKLIFFRNAHLIFAAALSLWLANHSTAAESPPGTSHSVDLLAAFRFSESASVEKTTGICSHREGQHASDKAYRLKEKAVLSVPTATAFPGTDTN